jgi:uncharacterized membrane protein
MPKSKNTQLETSTTTAKTEVVDQEPIQNTNPSISATFNQQNNFHLVQNIDLDKLAILHDKSPDIANRVISLYEKQQEHNISSDKRILTLEEKEQVVRHSEIPNRRKFAFASLYFAAGLSILSLGFAGYFAYLGYPVLAGIAISIVAGTVAVNILGLKAAKHEENKKDNDKKEE